MAPTCTCRPVRIQFQRRVRSRPLFLTSNPLTSPCAAGLSHIGEEGEEIILGPACALDLSAQRGRVVVAAQDVESEPAQDGEIWGSVVLSGAVAILVENDIEGPVQAVFDAPMFAHDAQHLGGIVSAGEQVEPFGTFAV